jgi:hypothetical protein
MSAGGLNYESGDHNIIALFTLKKINIFSLDCKVITREPFACNNLNRRALKFVE